MQSFVSSGSLCHETIAVCSNNYSHMLVFLGLINNSVWLIDLRTGSALKPVTWSPAARPNRRRTTGSKLRWGTAPPLARRGVASPKSAPRRLPLSKQKLPRPPPLKTQPPTRSLPRAQHRPPSRSPTPQTVIIQAKTDSQTCPPPDGANPSGCRCQSSSALWTQEPERMLTVVRQKAFLTPQGLGTEKKVKLIIKQVKELVRILKPIVKVSAVINCTRATLVFNFSIPPLSPFQGTHFSFCTHTQGCQ